MAMNPSEFTHPDDEQRAIEARCLTALAQREHSRAELVAKWRTVGVLTTTTTTTSCMDPEDLTRAPGPALIMPHLRTTPLYTHPLLRKRPRILYR